jgi:acyl dehydratase
VVVETTSTLILRGQGGFGGSPGRRAEPVTVPSRPADEEITYHTSEDQALLYRLSGDRNPLHSDPWFAVERAGFPRPILHGLCTYGYSGRALLAAVCDNEPRKFKKMACRFAAPVYPGETLTTSLWRTGPGTAVFQTSASGAADQPTRVVLADGAVEFDASNQGSAHE